METVSDSNSIIIENDMKDSITYTIRKEITMFKRIGMIELLIKAVMENSLILLCKITAFINTTNQPDNISIIYAKKTEKPFLYPNQIIGNVNKKTEPEMMLNLFMSPVAWIPVITI